MNGVDVIVFTAGLGENSANKERICKDMSFLGVELMKRKHQREVDVLKDGSKQRLLFIPTNEELMIARYGKTGRGI